MEKHTAQINGRTVELEIVQNGTQGWAVNMPEADDCIGFITYGLGGYRATDAAGNDLGETTSPLAALAGVIARRAEDEDKLPAGAVHFLPSGWSSEYACGANAVGQRSTRRDTDHTKTTCGRCIASGTFAAVVMGRPDATLTRPQMVRAVAAATGRTLPWAAAAVTGAALKLGADKIEGHPFTEYTASAAVEVIREAAGTK